MSYYQENRPAMGGLADALAMQGRRGDSTLVHMNPMEVRMLETMSPDGRLSINPETGLPEAFKLKDIAAFALPIVAGIAAPYLIPAAWGLGAVGAGAVGAGLGGFGAGLIQGKGVKDSLVQGGISGLLSYGMGSMMAPGTMTGGAEAIQGGVTSTPALGADSMGLGGYSAAQEAAVTQGLGAAGIGAPDGSSLIAAGTPTSSFADIGLGPKGSVPYTAATDIYQPGTSETGLGQLFDRASRTSPFGQTNIYGDALGATQVPTYTQIGGSVLGSAGQMALEDMLSPEEMPYDIAGMDDMDAYYASRVPDLEAGRRRGRAAARSLNYPPSGSTGSQYYGMVTSPGGFGTFYAADGGQVPGALGDLPPHVAKGLMENPEIGTDAAAFSNLVHSQPVYSQPSTKDLLGSSSFFKGLPPYVAKGVMQNPEVLTDATAFSKLFHSQPVYSQPSTKDLLRSSSFFKGLPPHVAKGVMQNPEVLNDAAAFSNLVTGKASGIQTDQISNLAAGRLRGQAAARSLNYPLSGGSAADYYRMATSPGGFGTFYAADGGQVPKPYGDPYGPGDPYGGVADESNSGQSSSTGQSSGTPGSVDTSGFMSSLGDPIDIGLGIGNPSPIGMAASLAGLALGIPGLGPAVAIGRGIAGLMGPSVPGQVSGFGTTTGGPTGLGVDVTGQAIDPSFEAVAGLAEEAAVQGFANAHQGEVGDASPGGGMSSAEAATNAAESGQNGDGGHMAQGGVVDFYAQGGGISSLAYGGEAAPVGFANKAFEGMVPGQGTGMSDDIPFSIEGNQPALLSRDEYVLPADVVSQLGDGSSGAGADMLDNFISQVRRTKYGNTQQPAPVGPQLMTGLMRQGGVV